MQHRIPVAVLGATGSVGQKFIVMLENHPWFQLQAVCASARSAGKPYREAANWFQETPLPEQVANMTVRLCEPDLSCRLVFSGLDASVAGDIEERFAQAGYTVVSNARNFRMHAQVPLLIPEVNPDHLDLLKQQAFSGQLVTNPNCSTIGLVMALKPLWDRFGLEKVAVSTMQALSGAGYPGVSSLDILDNVVPFIGGEEQKMETEPLKLLGSLQDGKIVPAEITISAQCNRVPVLDGHMECVSVKLRRPPANREALIKAWQSFRGEPQRSKLPTAPAQPVVYMDDERYPQPKRHRNMGKGMTVVIGRLRPCPILDYKFVVLSHNTVRGAAGAALLNAELMWDRGLITIED